MTALLAIIGLAVGGGLLYWASRQSGPATDTKYEDPFYDDPEYKLDEIIRKAEDRIRVEGHR